MFAFVDVLILFGLTNKNDIPIHVLWSEKSILNLSVFASVTISRDRFQLICRHICFDDYDQRKNNQNNKFYKMQTIFNL